MQIAKGTTNLSISLISLKFSANYEIGLNFVIEKAHPEHLVQFMPTNSYKIIRADEIEKRFEIPMKIVKNAQNCDRRHFGLSYYIHYFARRLMD